MSTNNGASAILAASDAVGKSAEDLAFEAMMAERKARKTAGADKIRALERAAMFALNAAEIEEGDERVKLLDAAPLCKVVVGVPDPVAVKRFRQVSRSDRAKPADKTEASDAVGKSAVRWPTKENPCKVPGLPATYEDLCEAYPGLHDSVGMAAMTLAGILDKDDVGK